MPPEKIHIYDDKRVDKTILLGPYNEGSDVNLLCEVKGGKCYLINFRAYQKTAAKMERVFQKE